jgi:hypothetical protein
MDWFERLTGFPERDYATTKSLLDVAGHRLQSKVNGSSFATGTLETPSVKELRQRARGVSASLRGRVKVTCEPARDVADLHSDPGNENALFQVASQFNLLR